MAERVAGRLGAGLALAVVACLLAAATAPSAQACDSTNQHQFGVGPGCFDIRISAAPTATNAAPDYLQAAGHPYALTTAMRLNAPAENDPVHGEYWPPEALRDASVGLPAGIVANPSVVPPCSLEQLVGAGGNPTCSPDSQVGVITVSGAGLFGGLRVLELPFFRIAAPAGVPARFGFNATGSPTVFDAHSDVGAQGGISIDLEQVSQAQPLTGLDVDLWGVPADPSHTPQRACPGQVPPGGGVLAPPGETCAASLPERAFLRLPTSCTGPATLSARFDSWAHPGQFQTASVATHLSPGLLGDPRAGAGYPAPFPGLAAEQWGVPQGFEGCAQVPFDPSIAVRPTTRLADSPTGLDVEVSLPQRGLDDPDMLAEADLKQATVRFPVGLSLNPAVANGLGACSAAQVDLGSSLAPTCPDSAKLGTVEIASPLLESPLTGSIYIAEPEAGGAALPAYVVASSGGLVVKLLTSLDIDAATGQVSTTVSGTPQIPIDSLKLHFFAGERAPFVSPSRCGTYSSEARFTPWSGTSPVDASDSFAIVAGPGGRPCGDRPFSPGFSAGVTNPAAGGASALTMKLTRADGEQEPSALKMSLPPGLIASLRGVSSCPDAAIAAIGARAGAAELAAPSCPAASRIGVASLALGAGAEPFQMQTGKIYFAGPYQGAAFSFVIVVPAVAGPLDLGTTTLRLPLTIDPTDGHLTIESSLPTIQKGVPLDLRQMVLDVDRPGFLANPTSCRPARIDGLVSGDGGARASVSSPFQMQGCAALGFKPQLRASVLGGAAASRHRGHPAIRFTLSARRGDANIKRAVIVVAGSEQLEPSHLHGICKRPDFAAGNCPANSIYGHARAISPLLDKPLEGPVYLRSSSGNLPSLVASLRGPLDLDLEAKVGYAGGHLRIAMNSIPDVPVSKLALTTFGGRRGLFVNNRDLCAEPGFSVADLTGQNGKHSHSQAKLDAPCGG